MAALRQVGTIPVRRTGEGSIEVLLVTSRETRRWVIPKGWPVKGLADREAARREAWEEAGVRGRLKMQPIGNFTYLKRRGTDSVSVSVAVYLLQVTGEERSWPEKSERRRAWLAPAEAARAVQEPGLKRLLRRLDASRRPRAAAAARI